MDVFSGEERGSLLKPRINTADDVFLLLIQSEVITNKS